MKLVKELKEKHKEMSSWRRHLHRFPEIAYEEKKTAEFVAGKLEVLALRCIASWEEQVLLV